MNLTVSLPGLKVSLRNRLRSKWFETFHKLEAEIGGKSETLKQYSSLTRYVHPPCEFAASIGKSYKIY